MIRINRPKKIPKSIKNKGKQITDADCKSFEKDDKLFISEFKALSSVYGSRAVKKSLKKAQHNKCCFCEKNQVDEYGAVEHFRPKGGYKKTKEDKKLLKPGYYWLAYSWDNLLFVCGVCNTTYKKNFFPLIEEQKRAKSHLFDVSKEEPLLLNPCGDKNPENHVLFNNNLPFSRDIFGKKTIEICGLDRDALNSSRRKLISDIEARLVILIAKEAHQQKDLQNAWDFLVQCQKPESEFSSVARYYLKQFEIDFEQN